MSHFWKCEPHRTRPIFAPEKITEAVVSSAGMTAIILRSGESRGAKPEEPMLRYFAFALVCLTTVVGTSVAAADTVVERGKYLVAVIGCGDCHTPGYFLGKPDITKSLAGSNVGFAVPGLGVFVAPNLTPDQDTGLGKWTAEQIVAAITKGERPDGRILAPVMPWNDLSHLAKEDAVAIAAYLKSLPPIQNKVSGPFGPSEEASGLVFSIQPSNVYNSLPKPPPAQ
jgi:mono/diheme cytochrome c family protein